MITLWNFSDNSPLSYNESFNTEATSSTFTLSEKYGIIGSKGGTIIIWDHRKEKIMSTLKGHLNACTALGVQQEHEICNFIVSGSLDTNVKLWDTRE